MKSGFCFLILVVLVSCSDNSDKITACTINNPLEELGWLKEIKTGFEQSVDLSKKKIIHFTYQKKSFF